MSVSLRRLARVALAAFLLLAACGGEAEEVEIAFIPKAIGIPFFDRLATGLEEACRELQCRVTVVGPSSATATSQLPFIDAQAQRRVDAIVLVPNSPDALNRALDRARERGVKIIVLSDIIPPAHRDAALMGVDFDNVGADLVALMGRLMGYRGKFAILSATTDAPDQNRFIAGIRQALAEDERYRDMELVRTVYGDDDFQKSATETEVLLLNIPGLEGLLVPTAVGIVAAARIIATMEPDRRIALTGLGLPNEMRAYVKDGIVDAFQLWDPKDQGLAAAHVAHGLARGTLTAEAGQDVMVPTLGSFTFTDGGTLILREHLLTFTNENIDEYDF